MKASLTFKFYNQTYNMRIKESNIKYLIIISQIIPNQRIIAVSSIFSSLYIFLSMRVVCISNIYFHILFPFISLSHEI